MKVTCIDNSEWKDLLTINRDYEIVKIGGGFKPHPNCYLIKSDNNQLIWWDKSRFSI